MASNNKSGGRKGSLYSQPFPRDDSRKVTPPEYRDGMSVEDARSAWYAWLRIVGDLRQFNIPPKRRTKE